MKPNARLFTNAKWTKSSLSAGSGECVEVAKAGDFIGIRDSKDPSQHVLVFTLGEWRAFIGGIHQNEFP